jgi:hypothetical protein
VTCRLLRVLCGAGVVLLSSEIAGAQDVPARRTTTCWRGRPAPRCDAYWITELGYYRKLASTSQLVDYGFGPPQRQPHLEDHASIQLGRMTNRGATSAFGGTLQLGVGSAGPRAGIHARYRQWLGESAGLELSLGPQVGKFYQPFREDRIDDPVGGGFSGDVSLDLGNLIAVTARGDVLYADGRTAGAAYGGVRAGAQGSVVAGVATAIAFALLIAAISGADF